MLPTKEKIIASGDNEGMSIKLWMQNIIKQELSPELNLHVWRTYIAVMLASIKYNPHTHIFYWQRSLKKSFHKMIKNGRK